MIKKLIINETEKCFSGNLSGFSDRPPLTDDIHKAVEEKNYKITSLTVVWSELLNCYMFAGGYWYK